MPTLAIEVPQTAYATVLRQVADALDEASTPADEHVLVPPKPPTAGEASPSSTPEDVWTDAAMIREHLQPRTETPRAFMRWLADRPGTWAGTFAAYPDLGLQSPYELGGSLSGLQRYLDERDLPLPWSWKYDAEDRIVYQMHPDVSAAIKAHL